MLLICVTASGPGPSTSVSFASTLMIVGVSSITLMPVLLFATGASLTPATLICPVAVDCECAASSIVYWKNWALTAPWPRLLNAPFCVNVTVPSAATLSAAPLPVVIVAAGGLGDAGVLEGQHRLAVAGIRVAVVASAR